MSAQPPKTERSKMASPDKDGRPLFEHTLTSNSLTDIVKLTVKLDVLPVIFVPGIMGSNLRLKKDKSKVWRLDSTMGAPLGLAWSMSGVQAGPRQVLMHPDRTEVDPNGVVPKNIEGIGNVDAIHARGWGQVGQTSYGAFLQWLEETLNPAEHNPAFWHDYYQDQATISATPEPGARPKLFAGVRMGMKGQPFSAEIPFQAVMTDDLLKRSKFWMPVHAVGYNWLASNQEAANSTLRPAIERIIRDYDKGHFSCDQVILVTHSMGGLVARACAQLPGMQDKIAGIVHGVMPATGAAVAYRRCKVGMRDEDFGASIVIGKTGQEVTAVFAQAPGALQLLPSKDYRPGWLGVLQGPSGVQAWPQADPYEEIYKVRDKWWGLVNEEWLSPKDGQPIKWGEFNKNVTLAQNFHDELSGKYHPATYVFYGADAKQPSFEHVKWRMKPGRAPDSKRAPDAASVLGMSAQQVRTDGTTPEYVGGQHETQTYDSPDGPINIEYESSYWELHCEMHDGVGDGTVPDSSGRSPKERGGANIKQQFRLAGFAHEPAFKNGTARQATVYAITKIAGTAKITT